MPITVTHDGPVDLAEGRSRRETSWKNKSIAWAALLEKLSVTHRTHEKFSVYISSKKPEQDALKDIGGFVGGYLKKGKRSNQSVSFRSIITLDVDYAPKDFWDDFTMMYGYAACIYSTHSHKPEKPRYRLVIPLDRHVLCDEYIAISRRVAGDLGIDYFCPVSFRPAQLMYWPSTAKDGQYVFNYQDGAWLSADEVLATYHDWTDSSEWPVSEAEGTAVNAAIKKQGDPTEKTGIVGSFCRSYSIHEAIDKYLSDIYTPCDIEGRYTYVNGTTSAGMVTYDDKFAYSHHGTDPTSGKLCNAFDLVRIHLFGLKDEHVQSDTPVNKRPSHIAMEEYATRDPLVRKLVVSERLAAAQHDFEPEEEDESDKPRLSGAAAVTEDFTEQDEKGDDWMEELACDKKGNVLSTIDNMVVLLSNAPGVRGRFAFDEFAQRPVLTRNVPWRKVTHGTRYVTDTDDDCLHHWLEKNYGINANKKDVALSVMYNKKSFHPVKDYLSGLTWDGVKRVDSLLIDFLGARDDKYTRTVTRKTLVAAVKRVYEPGCKFDTVLMLIGPEGKYKSTLFQKLGREWFSDDFSFNMLKDKRSIEQLMGRWIVEIGEMSGFKKSDRNDAKAFLSRRADECRLAFGHHKTTLPRQNIFVSSTNENDPLQENSGNRRFWPVKILRNKPTRNVPDMTDEDVNQIWAEVLTYYKAGETIYLSGKMEQTAKEVQTEHTEVHPWSGTVSRYINALLPAEWDKLDRYGRTSWFSSDEEMRLPGVIPRDRICVNELWCEALARAEKDLSTYTVRDLHAIMRNMDGWTEAEGTIDFGIWGPQRRGYVRAGVTLVSPSGELSNKLEDLG